MTGSLTVQPFAILLGAGTLLFGACPRSEERDSPRLPSARFALRLHAFATTLHE